MNKAIEQGKKEYEEKRIVEIGFIYINPYRVKCIFCGKEYKRNSFKKITLHNCKGQNEYKRH